MSSFDKAILVIPNDGPLFWSWLAGFFEGDGSCGFYRDKRRRNGTIGYRLQASISQKDRRVLDYIKKALEYGSVAPNRGSYGNVYHWRTDCALARRFLKGISPHLRSPKRIAQVATALRGDAKKITPGRGIYRRRLNGQFR